MIWQLLSLYEDLFVIMNTQKQNEIWKGTATVYKTGLINFETFTLILSVLLVAFF